MSYKTRLDEVLGNVASMEGEDGCCPSRTMTDREVMLESRKLIQIMVSFFNGRDTLGTMYRKYCEFAHHPSLGPLARNATKSTAVLTRKDLRVRPRRLYNGDDHA
jgi:hypothetical protein